MLKISGTVSRLGRPLTILFAFLAGIALGAGVLWGYQKEKFADAYEVMGDLHASAMFNQEIAEAEKEYANQNRDVAIYALGRAVRNIGTYNRPSRMSCREVAYAIGKYNVRLAVLHGEAGNASAREAHLEQARSAYAVLGWRLKDTRELAEAIPLIEAGKTSSALTMYGQIGTPCDNG
ncbi:MAG: hypothetical protein REI94_17520 [Moraxellaceae bacterium]|nr:hypothetical protein [Moraxellaceae bacterium]